MSVSNTATNQTRRVPTNESGNFTVPFLSPGVYDIRVENTKVKVGVRQTGDRPISAVNFWSIRTTVCPEAYIHIKVEPKQSFKWTIRYEFYELGK